jgi:hypothetical protein
MLRFAQHDEEGNDFRRGVLGGCPRIQVPLPLEGERLGEGMEFQALTPSPRPSPSREREFSDKLLGATLAFEFLEGIYSLHVGDTVGE